MSQNSGEFQPGFSGPGSEVASIRGGAAGHNHHVHNLDHGQNYFYVYVDVDVNVR